jgi:hypothetical protein
VEVVDPVQPLVLALAIQAALVVVEPLVAMVEKMVLVEMAQ